MTDRKPARDVIGETELKGIAYARDSDGNARAYLVGPVNADIILSALTEAGYPVEAGPAMREALEEAIPHLREHTVCTAMRADGNVAECQAHGGAIHALALAREQS